MQFVMHSIDSSNCLGVKGLIAFNMKLARRDDFGFSLICHEINVFHLWS